MVPESEPVPTSGVFWGSHNPDCHSSSCCLQVNKGQLSESKSSRQSLIEAQDILSILKDFMQRWLLHNGGTAGALTLLTNLYPKRSDLDRSG